MGPLPYCHLAGSGVNRAVAPATGKTGSSGQPYRLFGSSARYDCRPPLVIDSAARLGENVNLRMADAARAAGPIDCGNATLESILKSSTPPHCDQGKTMTVRSAIMTLLVLALALPVVAAVLLWVRGLLASMGDAAGAAVIGHVGTACQVAWTISLVGLVIALAVQALQDMPPDESE
jgi:hypothetical protein